MKVLIPVVTFLVILFSCCSGNRYPDVLIAVDSIADTNPKKALTMLDSISAQMSNADEAVKNYYELLQIKAEDKAYVEHKSDILIKRLVSYYENDGDKNLLPMVYYYAGRINFDLNNLPEALKFFQKVLDVTAEEEPLRYKTYSQMGYVFLYQNLYDEGIKAFMQAYEYNKKIGNKNNQVYELCGIGDCYKRKNDNTTASRYYKKALALSEEIGNSMIQYSIFAQMAKFYYNRNEYSIANDYIRRALNGVDSVNRRNIYSVAVTIYKGLGKNDSVFLFCNKLYELDDIYAKQFASKNLSLYFLEKRDISNALFYLKHYEAFSDSLQKITQTQSVAKINALYNYQLKEKENIQLKAELIEKREGIFSMCLFTVFLIVVFIIYIIYLNKRKCDHIEIVKKRFCLLREIYENKEKALIEFNDKKIEELTKKIESLESENERLKLTIAEEREKLKNINNMYEMKNKKQMIFESEIRKTDIYKKILSIWNNRTSDNMCRLSKEDWDCLDREVNKHFANFKERISEVCKIDDHVYKVCLLLKINMPPSGIALFTNKSDNAISSTRKRLCNRAFGGTNAPKDWDAFIRSL